MNARIRIALGFLSCLLVAPSVQAGVGVAVGVNFPVGRCHRPYYGCGYYRYRPCFAPLFLPPPVIVAPVRVVQPVQVVEPAYVAAPTPAPAEQPTVVRAAHSADQSAEVERLLQHLGNPDEKARAEAVLQLGRLRAARGVEPLTKALTADRSPVVREAAARGLGLIAAPASLQALQQAAQADDDRDVRNSARFAADVIRSQVPPR